VSPERDDPTEEHEQDLYEDVPPRSIFAATWFRVVLVVIVLGVVGAVAVPYVLDWMNPPPPPRTAGTAKSPMTPSMPPAIDKPLADRPTSDKSPSEKSPSDKATDKKDGTLIPAPPASTPTPSAARPETKSEPKSSAPPAAKPTAEPKVTAKAATPEPKAPAESKPTPEPKSTAPATGDAKNADAKNKSAMAVTESSPKSSASKSAATKSETTPKSDTAPATATKPTTTKPAAAKATTPTSSSIGGAPYWVQVGAFKDPETAKRVAAKLREENFKVEESVKQVGGSSPAPATKATPPAPPAATSSDQYDVFVTGMSADDLNRRLAGKGLAAEASGGGVVVKPSLPLRDAVALSKDLAVEGFKVQVRRAGGAGPVVTPPTAPAPTAAEGGQSLHRVRVGSFADKAAALAAARELEAKGYKPYIARGDQ
jgi:cell division septation protein DedD